jgi:hypothetical protein
VSYWIFKTTINPSTQNNSIARACQKEQGKVLTREREGKGWKSSPES